jgi:hypothetical protein
LRDAGRFYDRRPSLAFGKPRGLVSIRINAAKLLAVGVIDGDQPVVMLTPAVCSEGINIFLAVLLRLIFCHSDRPDLKG